MGGETWYDTQQKGGWNWNGDNHTVHRRHPATEATAPSYEEEMERDEEGLMEHWCRFICWNDWRWHLTDDFMPKLFSKGILAWLVTSNQNQNH